MVIYKMKIPAYYISNSHANFKNQNAFRLKNVEILTDFNSGTLSPLLHMEKSNDARITMRIHLATHRVLNHEQNTFCSILDTLIQSQTSPYGYTLN